MYYLYFLKSIATGRYYVGITNDTNERLAQHNSGMVRSTKRYAPYRLVRVERYATKKEARQKEISLKKSGHIDRYLKNFTALSSNG
ncbi:MAG: GIY-YIG nuclease family protein [Patescibacteria group bacterium]